MNVDLILDIALSLIAIFTAIVLHEVAHGYIAERFGDPTARLLGRLTMNPFKHLDPIGTIAIFIFGFGWAITGACPGPIFAQIGAGAYPAIFTLLGAIIGAYLYYRFKGIV